MVAELKIAVEPWAMARLGVMRLCPALGEEAPQSAHTPVPKVDTAIYDGMAADGRLICVTARDGGVVGFWLAFLSYHPHHKGLVTCCGDLVFLKPEYRRGFNAARMLRALIGEAREAGASVMYCNSPIGRDLGPLLRRFGLAPVETQYSVWF